MADMSGSLLKLSSSIWFGTRILETPHSMHTSHLTFTHTIPHLIRVDV